MRHTLRLSGRFLPTWLLIAAGLGSFGCGDSATVNPVVELSSLSVTTGTTTAALQPSFSRATTDYTVQLSSGVTSVTVSARAAVDGDSVSINGQPTTNRAIALEPAGQTTVVNVVVSESNTNSRTYTVKLVRAGLGGINSLRTLFISPGKLSPVFDKDEQFYRVDEIDSSVTKVTVTATPEDPDATMTVDGQDTDSGQGREIPLEPAGDITIIEIFVKAQNGQVKQYHVEVPRGKSGNNDLKNLTLSPGTLDKAFNVCTVDCTLNVPIVVPNNVTNVTVTPELADPTTATMTVNGQATTNRQARTAPLPAAGSRNSISIVVTAQNGVQKTYRVEVVRAAPAGNNSLRSLTILSGNSNLTLAPSFNSNILGYTVDVGSAATSVTVRPTLDDTSASMSIRVNSGTPTNISSGQSRSIPLGAPDSITFINIIVTAQNSSQKTYVVAVDKAPSNDNNLSALSVRVGNTPQALSPRFARNIASYTVDVASNVTRVTVSATKADRFAAMAIGSVTVGSGTETGQANISLGGQGSETPVSITVTPQIGNPKTYSLTITRLSSNTNLSALSVTAGAAVLPLSPPFDGSNTVNVATDITSVTVTATLEDTNASMEINGQGTSSGVPSAPITLEGPPPSNTRIPIVVISPNGNRKNYTLTVSRAAPTAPQTPTVAPDLIEEDDSCPLIFPNNLNQCVVGSRNDNITNVTTPRFRIPQPGVGETPTLYSGKDQVPASFNQGDNTLQPTSALSDGDHSISYTLSNAGSESGKSPALTVTIDSAPPGNPGG